jgi:hypothetical protein
VLSNADNGLIYAESQYLDAVSPNWDAIISEDYEFIMPLTWRKKWGIRYLVQPPFSQQGGIFSKHQITENTVLHFLEKAKTAFRFAEFTLNFKHLASSSNTTKRTNYVLSLKETYDNLFSQYSTSIKQIIHSSKMQSLSYRIGNDTDEAINKIRETNGEKLKGISEVDFIRFIKLCKQNQNHDRLIIREVYHNEEWLSSALLIKDEKRIYNLLSCNSEKGRSLNANHFLYDRLIAEFAESKYLLDFEGSDLSGVAFFYRSFNPKEEAYEFIKWNRLSLPLRWLKN